MLRKLLLDICKEVGDGHTQAAGDGQNRLDRQVTFAAFNAAHVRAVQAAMVGKGLLRKTFSRPQLPNSFAKNLLEVCHLSQSGKRPIKGLQTSCGQPSYGV